MHFTFDYQRLWILLLGLVLFSILKIMLKSSDITPSLAFSRIKNFQFTSWKTRLLNVLMPLHLSAFACFMLAFIDPHFLFPKKSLSSSQAPESSTEGIAMYLVLDQSGSMSEPVVANLENGSQENIPKIDLLKRFTKQFIVDHPSDLIGLVSFARVPRVLVPLTLDQDALLKNLENIQVVKKPDEDGTAIGYAIYKTAHLIAATRAFAQELPQKEHLPFTIKSAAIIVVTDGFQDPNRLDQGNRLRTIELDDAAMYAKSEGIRLYMINIDPVLGTMEYAPHRRQLNAITQSTGGQFYLVDNQQSLQQIYASIDQLEKGKIKEPGLQPLDEKNAFDRFSLYPFFIIIGLVCLLTALFMDSYFLKTVP